MYAAIARLMSSTRSRPRRGPCGDLLGQPLLQPRPRDVPEIATRLLGVRARVAGVSRHGREVPHRHIAAEELAEDLDHLENCGLGAAGDVVRLAGTSLRGRSDRGADRVVD